MAVATILATLLVGCSDRSNPPEVVSTPYQFDVVIPARPECEGEVEHRTDAEPERLQVARLCRDDWYGDYLLWDVRFVALDGRSRVEMAIRELWRDTTFIDALVGVDLVDGLALVRFPANHHRTDAWRNAYGTADQIRGFFPPLLATAYQFEGVDAVSLRFGEEAWWPDERGSPEPYRAEQWEGLPFAPRDVEPSSAIAAIPPVADGLHQDHSDATWFRSITRVAPAAGAVVVSTTLKSSDLPAARDIHSAVVKIVSEDARRCQLGVRVLDESGRPMTLGELSTC